MKYLVALALAATLTLPVQAEERPVISQPYAPRLGDIMGMTQLRHFKLWYAGREKNWNLAKYELGQPPAIAATRRKAMASLSSKCRPLRPSIMRFLGPNSCSASLGSAT